MFQSASVVLPGEGEIEALEGRELDAVLWELEQVRRRVEARVALVVERSHRTGQFTADGHRTVKAWTMAVTNCSPAEAAQRRRVSRVMDVLPAVRTEFVAGRVGVAQVHEVARIAANPRCRDQMPGSEQVLLEPAKQLQFEDFRIHSRRWEQLADQDGAFRDHDAALEHRNASLTEAGGVFEWRTRHGAVHGTTMQQIFQAFVDAQFRADWDAAVAEHGNAACAALLPRTPAQRRADALLAIFETAAAAGINGKPINVCLNLVMDNDQYEQTLRNMIDGTAIEIDPATVRDRRCETADGVPVDPRQAVALSLIGHVRRVVFNTNGVIIDAGRKRRLFTGPVRELLQTIEPRCLWLGCMIRAAIAQLDHLEEFAKGGLTNAANGRIECGTHNLFKHRNDYTVTPQPGGGYLITRHDGTQLKPPDAA